MIDLHLRFSSVESVKTAHDMVHHIQSDIQQRFTESRIMIHIEPCTSECGDCNVIDCTTRKNEYKK